MMMIILMMMMMMIMMMMMMMIGYSQAGCIAMFQDTPTGIF